MAEIVWPTEPVTLAEAARLFAAAGRPVDRSNLSRYVASRNVAYVQKGRFKLVDARALFDLYTEDYGRKLMAGETQNAAPSPPGAAAPAGPTLPADAAGGREGLTSPAGAPEDRPEDRRDPKREETELKVQARRIALARELGQVVPVEEVEAATAEAIADLRAAYAQALRDVADAMAVELGLPANRVAALRVALKRYARLGQEAFAARMAAAVKGDAETAENARARLIQLAGHSIRLRGGGAPE